MAFQGRNRRERGAAALLFAVALPVLIAIVAMVVDLGYGYYSRQRLQAALDLAAISAARELDGSSGQRTAAIAAANRTLQDNGFTAEAVNVYDFGDYSRGRPLGSRFSAIASGNSGVNAIRLEATDDSPRFFAGIVGADPIDVTVRSTAMTTGRHATVKIASGLANLNDGLLNLILGALLGGNVNLSVLDYKGLVGANVELLGFLDEYAIRVGAEVGNYDELLHADASVLGVLGVVADIAKNAANGDSKAVRLGVGLGDAFPGISKLPLLVLSDVNVKLGDLLGVGLGNNASGLSVPVNVFDLITASILAASTQENATGQHAVTVNLSTFLGASVDVSIVEPAQPPTGYRVITEDDIRTGNNLLRTSQIRILLRVDWKGPLSGVITVVNGLLDILQVLGLDVDLLPTYGLHANDNLSIGINVAPAQARVTKLGCEPDRGEDRYVEMDVDTGLVSAHVGQIDRAAFLSNSAAAHADTFNVLGLYYNLWGLINPPIDILTVGLGVNLTVGGPTARPSVKASDALDQPAFADIAALFDEPGHEPDSAAFPSGVTIGTNKIITTLGKSLRDALGLQLGGYLGTYVLQPLVDLVTFIVGDVLIGMVLGPILDVIVDFLLDVLGINVGTAEVAVIDLECGSPRLVAP
ncbi:pilus assembly protein TadG-related protein [Zavarzinia sp.]|uniref:pilus assembly protein TadG-related protein n=1 Tax=Zavarzinia sp. TaxID=2027920 RepID=UPI003BB6C1DB